MRCPNCGHSEDRVLDTRPVREGCAIRRRRECLACQHRFTTYEYVEAGTFQVVKKDNRREPFAREKLIHGLAKACEKRPISATVIEEMADRIEADLARTGKSEVRSSDVGARVLEELRRLDAVAYVRFASVYLNFSDIRQFLETIHELPGGQPQGHGPEGAAPEHLVKDRGPSTQGV
jgi:transcriptional repressor NrdR